MGSSGSKKKKTQEEIDAESVFDRSKIYWDKHGNLRYDENKTDLDRTAQLRRIIEVDHVENEDGKISCIVDSAWIASWLAHVYYDKNDAPAPGPCLNRRLLVWDYNEHKNVGRFGLLMATKLSGGDYRRVSEECWKILQEYYPGSGPTIQMVYNSENKANDGNYDVSQWIIVDPPPPPEDDGIKKTKMRAFFTRKNAAEVEGKAEKPTTTGADTEAVLESKVADSDDDSDEDIIVPTKAKQDYLQLSNDGSTKSDRLISDRSDESDLARLRAQDERALSQEPKSDAYYEGIFLKKG